MNLCSFMCRAELLAQQPALSGAVVFGGVRVRPCDHEARSNVCSDNQATCREYQKALERQYNDICARARVDEARRFMGETAGTPNLWRAPGNEYVRRGTLSGAHGKGGQSNVAASLRRPGLPIPRASRAVHAALGLGQCVLGLCDAELGLAYLS